MKKIAILGSTGSIGTQTLEVVENNGDIQVDSPVGRRKCGPSRETGRENFILLSSLYVREDAGEGAERTVSRYGYPHRDTEWTVSLRLPRMPETDILVTAIVGMIGILPTIEAIKAGKDIALANKETLVTAGHMIMPLAERNGCSDPSGGQRAQRHFPVPFTGKTGSGIEKILTHGLRRSLPGKEPGGTCRMFRWRTP